MQLARNRNEKRVCETKISHILFRTHIDMYVIGFRFRSFVSKLIYFLLVAGAQTLNWTKNINVIIYENIFICTGKGEENKKREHQARQKRTNDNNNKMEVKTLMEYELSSFAREWERIYHPLITFYLYDHGDTLGCTVARNLIRLYRWQLNIFNATTEPTDWPF